mmetsp:Transcript_138595/g.276326  ORF Transcript_138595/g.276326 Transcript_138595/m.276326 type:complete len:527 (+) Transcript_138595:85-1665(+)
MTVPSAVSHIQELGRRTSREAMLHQDPPPVRDEIEDRLSVIERLTMITEERIGTLEQEVQQQSSNFAAEIGRLGHLIRLEQGARAASLTQLRQLVETEGGHHRQQLHQQCDSVIEQQVSLQANVASLNQQLVEATTRRAEWTNGEQTSENALFRDVVECIGGHREQLRQDTDRYRESYRKELLALQHELQAQLREQLERANAEMATLQGQKQEFLALFQHQVQAQTQQQQQDVQSAETILEGHREDLLALKHELQTHLQLLKDRSGSETSAFEESVGELSKRSEQNKRPWNARDSRLQEDIQVMRLAKMKSHFMLPQVPAGTSSAPTPAAALTRQMQLICRTAPRQCASLQVPAEETTPQQGACLQVPAIARSASPSPPPVCSTALPHWAQIGTAAYSLSPSPVRTAASVSTPCPQWTPSSIAACTGPRVMRIPEPTCSRPARPLWREWTRARSAPASPMLAHRRGGCLQQQQLQQPQQQQQQLFHHSSARRCSGVRSPQEGPGLGLRSTQQHRTSSSSPSRRERL